MARGGTVLRAEYFNGGGPDSLEYVWSVTKSVLALTVGAALDTGCLRSLDQTLGELLFVPLGIPRRPWETDRQGFNNGAAGLSLTAADMQAIGTMVLDSGRFRGGHVLPSAWIQAMTRQQITTGGGATPWYGYAWWVGRTLAGDPFALANGWGGQFIAVVPARGLVVTTAARATGLSGASAMAQWDRIFEIVYARIIPAY